MTDLITTKPFASKRQARWAFANKKRWARRWAKETDFAILPASKDADVVDGAPLHGPGGLLATPGMGGKRKKRRWSTRMKAAGYSARAGETIRGNLKRGTDGKFTSGGASSAPAQRGVQISKQPKPIARSAPTAPKGGKGGGKGKKGTAAAKPKKAQQTPEEKRQQREQEQAQNRADVLAKMNIAPDGQQALSALRDGQQPDAGAIARGGFVEAGLVEQAQDGSYRLTSSGRAMLSAADAGDFGRAGGTVSSARDRAGARTERQQQATQRRAEAERKRTEREQARAAAAKKKPAGGGGGGGAKKPAATPERQAEIRAERRNDTANATAAQVGLNSDLLDSLRTAADTGGVAIPDLVNQGLQDPDGLATDAGRRALSALERGDVRGYRAALQDARARQQRESAAGARRIEADIRKRDAAARRLRSARTKAVGSPGDYLVVEDRAKPSTWHLQVKRNGTPDHRLMGAAWAALHGGYRGNKYAGPQKTEALNKLKALYRAEKMDLPSEKAFTVFKDASGAHRWIARTTTAYRDRDGEILSVDALDRDSQRMMATRQLGPLRWWHVGDPDPLDAAAPWGPGLDIGDCDYSVVIGRTRVESGSFRDAAIARKMAGIADELEMSPGFFHPIDQPGSDGVFHQIRTFERSPVPTRYSRASNLFTGFAVKESRMQVDEMERRFKAMIDTLQLAPEQAQSLAAGLVQTEKAAAEQGIAYKSDEAAAESAPPSEIVIGGVTYTVKAAPPPPLAAEAAPEPMVKMQDDGEMLPEEDMGMDDNVVGNMSPDEFWAGMTQAITSGLAPLIKTLGVIDELKSMMGGVTTKDDARSQEIAALKAQIEAQQTALKDTQTKLTELSGDQPAVTLPAEIEAALKSEGPAAPTAPPDPTKPEVPNDPTRPWAGWGALTFPELYGQPPHGGQS